MGFGMHCSHHRFTHIPGLSQRIRVQFPPRASTQTVCVCVCVWGEQFKACHTSTGKVSEDTRQRFYSFACAFLFPTRGSCILLRTFYSNRRMEGGRKISPVWRWRTRRWAERRWTRSWQSGRSASALGRCGCSPAAPLISWRREDKRWGGEIGRVKERT